MTIAFSKHFRQNPSYYKRTIDTLDNRVESLSYPLFFMAGETAWGLNMSGDNNSVSVSSKNGVPFMNYLAHRMLCPENDSHGYPLMCYAKHPNPDGSPRLIHTNRFEVHIV